MVVVVVLVVVLLLVEVMVVGAVVVAAVVEEEEEVVVVVVGGAAAAAAAAVPIAAVVNTRIGISLKPSALLPGPTGWLGGGKEGKVEAEMAEPWSNRSKFFFITVVACAPRVPAGRAAIPTTHFCPCCMTPMTG